MGASECVSCSMSELTCCQGYIYKRCSPDAMAPVPMNLSRFERIAGHHLALVGIISC